MESQSLPGDLAAHLRPQRERRLPQHFDDFQVGYQPAVTEASALATQPTATAEEEATTPELTVVKPPSRPRSVRTESRRSSVASHQTRAKSQASVRSLSQRSTTEGLSELQSAMLEEKVKRMELAEAQRQVMEQTIVDEQCTLLDQQARDALNEREELLREQERQRRRLEEKADLAYKAKEAITRQQLLQQRLKEKEMEVERAALITSFLKEEESKSPPYSRPLSECSKYAAQLQSQREPGLGHSTPFTQAPVFNAAVNPPVSTSLPPAAALQNRVPATTKCIHALYSTTIPSAVSCPDQRATDGYSQAHVQPAYPPPAQTVPQALSRLPYSYPAMPPVPPQVTAPPPGFRATPSTDLMELLVATSYGLPKPALPHFTSGKESDFALLKMALDNLLNSHAHLTEQFKYQVLLDHLKLPSAYKLAQAYMHDPRPYTSALQALQDKYGQPRQLVQSELGAILNLPQIKAGDPEAFDNFALSVQALVGMLRSLEGENGYELRCGSHVDRLLSKLPANYRDGFVEYSINQGILQTGTDKTYTLFDLSAWLQLKSQAKRISSRAALMFQDSPKPVKPQKKPQGHSSTVYYNTESQARVTHPDPVSSSKPTPKAKPSFKPYCPYCDQREHYLSLCPKFKTLSTAEIAAWIKDRGCWRCGRNHSPEACTLKKPCNTCKQLHLTVLHEVSQPEPKKVLMVSAAPDTVYVDRPSRPQRVMLKLVKVRLYNAEHSLDGFAILDDGSERTLILPSAVQHLHLTKEPEILPLRTVRHEVIHLQGATVSFEISPAHSPKSSYPVKSLQRKYSHLQKLPLPSVDKVQPVLLIGSDFPHLLLPKQPVRAGPPGSPIAVCTALGWALQGPATLSHRADDLPHCYFTMSPASELQRHVERLWEVDVAPYANIKTATRSKEDQQALELLEQRTVKVEVDGVTRYATPLLRRKASPSLWASKNTLLPQLRSTERRLAKDPALADTYCQEIQKLEQSGYVTPLPSETVDSSTESWYLPHHVVHHNGKARIVYNCSYQHNDQSLNNQLLPGPTLGPSLLGVLLRFREHCVAISGDIKAMFHQVRLLPEDKPLLRFLWRSMKRREEPTVYEWQVLPFGTTCSPCCATYALQMHVKDNSQGHDDIQHLVETAFYVDNCLTSLTSASKAKTIIDRMRQLLLTGGFDIRLWASNIPSVVEHLPAEAKAASTELWLSQYRQDPEEPALGLRWNCLTDRLGYRHRPVEYSQPTLRNVYKVLATQYDPLGYLIPFTTRAKILIQDLWKVGVGWDDPIQPEALLDLWNQWESELAYLPQVEIPRCYVPPEADSDMPRREAHIFCDASERAYGAVEYLRTQDSQDEVHIAFVMARSRVSPRKQLSMPRLELCAALAGAQLAKVTMTELLLTPQHITLWTDSTTVLTWLNSDSCRYKVFVGTRVAEIQELTEGCNWRYVSTTDNPADDLTRGKALQELSQSSRWSQGPHFLRQHPDSWPVLHVEEAQEEEEELRKPVFCGATTCPPSSSIPDIDNWDGLIRATHETLHGAANDHSNPAMTAADVQAAELHLLQQSQRDSFPEEVDALATSKPISRQSRLVMLAPEYDAAVGLMRVGGRLRRAEDLDPDSMHPIILDPKHYVTKLLIKKYDTDLLHPGPERVFAELRRRYWILRGRESIKRHQHGCVECQKWRASPVVPKMADLPPARLRLYKPPFWSTGIDCFGPYNVKVGRRTEKRWGLIFKCMTTSCVHLDLLESMDTDAFLMALRRFIARRGKPFEILADRGTNFRGGATELQASFAALEEPLQNQLADQQIEFRFNPPGSPHFGGTWEREIKTIKAALQVVLRDQTVAEPVLQTVLIEVEGLLNAKPLGYISSDAADPDPVTPNLLLMGRRDASLPQAIYASSDLLSRRRWRHSQILADHFWSHFIRRHLPDLQKRSKWHNDTDNLTIGQVVMVVDSQLPRAQWPIGRVVKICPGSDGRVRAAEVRINGQTYLRPVVRLVRLPAWED
ncbi:hypothetical protein WMY93_012488 [Mugilogobius chulae]|uniref:ribonuclease H n=1 Tax=Mugilogobius chulae TaxID=88201 RepID=A0AAW0P949_9GOBI